MEFSVTGEDFIRVIVNRLNDEDIRCYDTAIVQKLRAMTGAQLWQLAMLGDVTKWHNDRINKANPQNLPVITE